MEFPGSAISPEKLIDNLEANIVTPLLGLLFGLAVFYFILGVYEQSVSANNDAKGDRGRKHIQWGLIGMFVMVSAFGILNLIGNTINSIGKK